MRTLFFLAARIFFLGARMFFFAQGCFSSRKNKIPVSRKNTCDKEKKLVSIKTFVASEMISVGAV